jgi:hypothetical protein
MAAKLDSFYRHGRSSTAVLRFPSPIRSKSRTVPTDYGLRSDDCKGTIHLGKQSADASQYQLSIETNRSLLGLARRSALICCLSTKISASSATCDRNRSLAIPKISRHKSSIGYQHRAILSQLPARLNLRQGQGLAPTGKRRLVTAHTLVGHRAMPEKCRQVTSPCLTQSSRERAECSRRRHVDEAGAVEWGLVNGVIIASISVAKFITMIAAAPRSTARLSPLAVAIAPRTRASAPIDR